MNDLGHGQIWWADLDDEKIRPVLVLTRSWIAPKLRRVLAAPITSTIRGIPTELRIGKSEGLTQVCVANFDNVQLLEVDRLLELIGTVARNRWPEACAAMHHTMACLD